MDFPPNLLCEIGDDENIAEDGLQAFCDINWINVSRAYMRWSVCLPNKPPGAQVRDDKTEGAASSSTVKKGRRHKPTEVEKFNSIAHFRLCGMFVDRKLRPMTTAQNRRFHALTSYIDFIQTLKDSVKLHTDLVSARKVQHWDGPPGEELGSSESVFDSFIAKYNSTGLRLQKGASGSRNQ